MEGSWEQSCNTSIYDITIYIIDYLRESRNMEGSWAEQSCNTSIRYYNIEYELSDRIKGYGRQLGAVM